MENSKPGYITAGGKEKLLKRLTRAEGQIRGINRMVAADTYCIDVLTQISAAQAALDKVALELLRGHARHCLTATAVNDSHQNNTVADQALQTTQALLHKQADELVDAIGRLRSR